MDIIEIHRWKTHRKIVDLLSNPVNIIACPVGYGKTSILNNFASEYSCHQFMGQLEYQQTDKFLFEFCRKIFGYAMASQLSLIRVLEEKIQFLIALICLDARENKGFTILIDDYHLMETEMNSKIIMEIARETSEYYRVSFILSSRKFPKGQLRTFFQNNQKCVLTAQDLKITAEELAEILHKNNIDLPAAKTSEILINTEGWIMGVVASIKDAISSSRLEEYFAQTVENHIIRDFSKQFCDFLRIASRFEKIDMRLVDFFPDGDLMKKEIHKLVSNFFFIEKKHSFYVLHPCIARYFTTFLPPRDSDKMQLANYYRQEGALDQALYLYSEINAYEKMKEICLELISLMNPIKQQSQIHSILNKLPEEVLFSSWKLIVWYTYSCNFRISPDKKEEYYQKAISALKLDTSMDEITKVQWIREIQLLIALAYREDWKKMYLCLKEITPVKGKVDNILVKEFPYNFECPSGMNIIYRTGEMDAILEAALEIENLTSKYGNGLSLGSYYLYQAEANYLKGETELSSSCVKKALSIAKDSQQYSIAISALYVEMKLYAHEGNYKSAEACIHSMKYIVNLYGKHPERIVEIAKLWLFTRMGKEIPADIAEKKPSLNHLFEKGFGYESIARLFLLYKNKKYHEANAFLIQSIPLCEENNKDLCLIYLHIYGAFVSYQLKEMESARHHMKEAYRLALPDKIVMPFIESGKEIIKLLSEFKEEFSGSWRVMVVKNTKNFFLDMEGNRHKNKYRLSKREVEVIELAALGLKNGEIATELGIKENTIKEYMHNIFIKLDVSNRTEAVVKFHAG